MTAVMIGHGKAMVDGNVNNGTEAIGINRLCPITLGAKEGLALINGTQFSTAYALAGLFQAWRAAREALVISALSTDAIMGSTAPLEAEIHTLRNRAGSPPPPPCAPFWPDRKSAKATAMATPACRIPTASAASRR